MLSIARNGDSSLECTRPSNREKIAESKASELAKKTPTTATPARHTPSPTPSQLMGSFSTAVGRDSRGGRGGAALQAPYVVQGAGAVVQELD